MKMRSKVIPQMLSVQAVLTRAGHTMKRYILMAAIASAVGLLAPQTTAADEFAFDFEWGDISLCTTGYPNRVTNPIFSMLAVPAGTARIDFSLTDLDAPNYNHGGGRVAYSGQQTIQPGAFKYDSPCPPNGQHRYRWTARARDKDGKTLARTNAMKKYP